MAGLTIPDVLHRLPPLLEEARKFLRRCRRTKEPRVYVWRGAKRPAAVYPGSFDPWTLAHEAILRAARKRVRGTVLLLLDLRTIDKPKHASGLAERLAILALHFAEDERISIGVSTHGRFLEKARALRGHVRFIVGEDTWERVIAPRYYKHPDRELAELRVRAGFLVAPRGKTSPLLSPLRGSKTRERTDPRACGPGYILAAPSGPASPMHALAHGASCLSDGSGPGWSLRREAKVILPLSRVDQARSATKARAALSRGRTPFDQLAPDVLLCCWFLRIYGNPRLLPVWVVTAFVRQGNLILLMRRGAKVGTYQGLWSGVSGYLEWPVRGLARLLKRGPGDVALRQVRQELSQETEVPMLEFRHFSPR